ncbi:MAG: hypothetical protein IPI21_00940 [Propionivibrio sp.]|nr:hypothetical protein [Propionivibrio sp.]
MPLGYWQNGSAPNPFCQRISALNDLLTLQVIELTAGCFDLPYVPWCWLVFGSEGRLEQTLSTDQDNGLVFAAASEGEAAALRKVFLPFAQAVNGALDACGFPLCKGNIMASNPAWCLSLQEWQLAFGEWMSKSQPEALLNSTIFFDFRPLYGQGIRWPANCVNGCLPGRRSIRSSCVVWSRIP